MPEEPIRVAHFDHVTDRGDLVFVFDHRHFAVRIDDTLERGLMEAKQIKTEAQGIIQPQASSALPISSIQSYIRAGMDTARVAQQFSVNEALVRRFSAPVETEKKYAIEQFLSVSAPKKSKAHSNGDLIEASLRNARISPASIAWTATRRNHEPWHIHAKFEAAGRIVKADWSWDMRDNSVLSLNSTAKRLLGENETRQDILPTSMRQALNGTSHTPYDWMDEEFSGDDSGESEIPPVVQEHRQGSIPAPGHRMPSTTQPVSTASSPSSGRTSPSPANAQGNSSTHAAKVAQKSDSSAKASVPMPSDNGTGSGKGSGEFTSWLYGGKSTPTHSSSSDASPISSVHQGNGDDAQDASRQDGASVNRQQSGGQRQTDQRQEPSDTASSIESQRAGKSTEHGASNRKSGRSAVPSWDEILFGD